MVAKAFIPNPEKKLEVNHIDFRHNNAYYKNLEWVTPDENIAHNVKHNKKHNCTRKITKKQFNEIIRLRKEGVLIKDLAKTYGKTVETISRYLKRYSSKNNDRFDHLFS